MSLTDGKFGFVSLQVLQCFKKLHRTRLNVFKGDEKALTAGRLRINEEFKKNKEVQNEEAIKAVSKLYIFHS